MKDCKNFKQRGTSFLAGTLVLSMLLTACAGPEEDKNSAEKKSADAIVSACEKLAAASSFHTETAVDAKSGTGADEESLSFTVSSDLVTDASSGAFLFTLSAPAYHKAKREFYSAGGQECYSYVQWSYDDDIEPEESYSRAGSNVNMTFGQVLSGMYLDELMMAMYFILPTFSEKLGDIVEKKTDVKVTPRDFGGNRVEVSLSLADFCLLYEEDYNEDFRGSFTGSMSFDIAYSGILRNVEIFAQVVEDGIPATMNFSCAFTDVDSKTKVTAPWWYSEAAKCEVSEYLYVTDDYTIEYGFNGDNGAYLSDAKLIASKKLDFFDVPSGIEGRSVNSINPSALENIVKAGGSVILPYSVETDSDDKSYEFYDFLFFTRRERPENYFVNNVYFDGEWEMKNGKPAPTRGDVIDPSDPNQLDFDSMTAYELFISALNRTFSLLSVEYSFEYETVHKDFAERGSIHGWIADEDGLTIAEASRHRLQGTVESEWNGGSKHFLDTLTVDNFFPGAGGIEYFTDSGYDGHRSTFQVNLIDAPIRGVLSASSPILRDFNVLIPASVLNGVPVQKTADGYLIKFNMTQEQCWDLFMTSAISFHHNDLESASVVIEINNEGYMTSYTIGYTNADTFDSDTVSARMSVTFISPGRKVVVTEPAEYESYPDFDPDNFYYPEHDYV